MNLLYHKAGQSKEFRVIKVFPTTNVHPTFRWMAHGAYGGAQVCFHMWFAQKSTLKRFTSNDEGYYEITDLRMILIKHL